MVGDKLEKKNLEFECLSYNVLNECLSYNVMNECLSNGYLIIAQSCIFVFHPILKSPPSQKDFKFIKRKKIMLKIFGQIGYIFK